MSDEKSTVQKPAEPKPDLSHPAVASASKADGEAARIDFNDPNKPGEQAVAENLGMKRAESAKKPSSKSKD